MSSTPIVVQVRFGKDALQQLWRLTEEAIQRAISITVSRLREMARRYTPEDTGRLLDSFEISTTPKSIVMRWSALSPQGYDYAGVADVGRPGGVPIVAKTPRGLIWRDKRTGQWHRARQVTQGAMTGKFFSSTMRLEAQAILVEELRNEISLLGGP